MDLDLIIRNATIVTASDILQPGLSIGIKSGKVAAIALSLPATPTTKILDAEGAYVTPGGVDSHVHLHQDNAPTGDKWLSGSRSALCGGNTTILAFATQQRKDDSLIPVVEEYHARAKGQSYVDYGFHLILTNPSETVLGRQGKLGEDADDGGELKRMIEQEGISSVKLYMTYPAFRLGDREMLEVMMRCREVGMTVMVHAENADMIDMITTRLLKNTHTEPKYHALARPQIAEIEATYRAISLSTLTSTPILIVHMSSPVALSHARKAQSKQMLPIHAETCPHYMFLKSERLGATSHPFSTGEHEEHVHHHQHDEADEDEWAGARHICAPPLRHSDADLQSVWDSITAGTITVISSDHAPSRYAHPLGKQKPRHEYASGKTTVKPSFANTPNGLPGIETRLPLLFSAAMQTGSGSGSARSLTLPKFVQLTSTNPARMYGLGGTKGAISPGYDADIVIWHPTHSSTGSRTSTSIVITNDKLHHSIDYTPFEGFEVANWPRYVLLRGELKFNHDLEVQGVEAGKGTGMGILGKEGDGRFLRRGRGEVLVGRMEGNVPGMKGGERAAWL